MHCAGGIRTIPPDFTRGLDFGPLADDPTSALIEEEEEEVEVKPIYRPMLELTNDAGRARAVTVRQYREKSTWHQQWLTRARTERSRFECAQARTRLGDRGALADSRAFLLSMTYSQVHALTRSPRSASSRLPRPSLRGEDPSSQSETGLTWSTSTARLSTSAISSPTWPARLVDGSHVKPLRLTN